MSLSLNEIVRLALAEDLPAGDVTTDPLGLSNKGSAKLVAKSDVVLSGTKFFDLSFKLLDPTVRIEWKFQDGSQVSNQSIVAHIVGPLASLLKSERTALNFLGHFSGVATLTSQFVAETKGTECKILDTRKTTPLYREWEKKAVRDGGGVNHRVNLSDAVLIKENHIRSAGGITAAVQKIRESFLAPNSLKIEVEVTNEKELKEALNLKVDQILLDNMSTTELKKSVTLKNEVNPKTQLEASGNMTLGRIKEVAATGVNFISVGALTHSAPTADLSLLFE